MRYILKPVLADLQKKMVFIGGPRQVGKTTLAKHILMSNYPEGRYLNWDYDEDRLAIRNARWTSDTPLLVLDELHKLPHWKTWLKGQYDATAEQHRFLVTGSAQLDVYRQGGDSLLGRYHYWRLHPFSLEEYPDGMSSDEALHRLMTVGGFPEPFLSGDEREARRWRRERLDRVIREDIRDLEAIRDIGSISLLVDLLRQRVGGLVKASNLAEDLKVSPRTITNWLAVLERMYLTFQVFPFTKSLPRAVQKPPKVYFIDTGDVLGDVGARFENVIAASLLKRLNYREDLDGYRYELRYLRDKEGREVDFAIVKDGELEELIEVKYGDDQPSRSLRYYADRLKPRRATQIVYGLTNPYDSQGIRVTDPASYFAASGPQRTQGTP